MNHEYNIKQEKMAKVRGGQNTISHHLTQNMMNIKFFTFQACISQIHCRPLSLQCHWFYECTAQQRKFSQSVQKNNFIASEEAFHEDSRLKTSYSISTVFIMNTVTPSDSGTKRGKWAQPRPADTQSVWNRELTCGPENPVNPYLSGDIYTEHE